MFQIMSLAKVGFVPTSDIIFFLQSLCLSDIKICLVRLPYLCAVVKIILLSILNEVGSSLHEMETDACLNALFPYTKHPFIITGASLKSRCTANSYLIDAVKFSVKADGFEHRFHYYLSMGNRQCLEYR